MAQRSGEGTVEIRNVYLMIHPSTWSMNPDRIPDGYLDLTGLDAMDWYAASNWEKEVNAKQMDFIENLPQDAFLVIFPGGGSPQMKALERHGQKVLGRRCKVLKHETVPDPRAIYDMDDPIRSFVHDGVHPLVWTERGLRL